MKRRLGSISEEEDRRRVSERNGEMKGRPYFSLIVRHLQQVCSALYKRTCFVRIEFSAIEWR